MKNTFKKLAGLLDAADRRSFILFVFISFLGGVIEVAGIGSVMPFIGVLMQPGLITTNHILSKIYACLHFTTPAQFIVFMGCLTLAVIISGGLINIFAVRYQLNLSYRIGDKWARRLFSSYLRQPYSFYLSTNSNTMKSGILSEVDRAVSSVLLPASVLISKTMVIAVILVMLLFVNAAITLLLMLVIGGIYGALLVYFRHKMHLRGRGMVAQNKSRFQITSEAFSGMREIKLYNSAGYFEGKFAVASEEYNMAQAYSLYFGQVPRFIIEITGFVTLIGLALYMVTIGESPAGHVIPLIALFAAAGYKMLPAAQNLYASINNMRFNSSSLSAVADGIALAAVERSGDIAVNSDIPFSCEIAVKNLTFSYENQSAPVLRDASCTIRKNSLAAVIGPTGAGKSTFIDLLAGLLQPVKGDILIDGQPLGPANTGAWQRKIGYVPQKIYLLDEAIEDNIAFGQPTEHIDAQRVAEAAGKAQIDGHIRSLPEGYRTVVGEHGDRLSGGQRQRIGIARALYRHPDVLILDEPTSALDTETARQLLATLKALSREKTVIVITHSLDVLKCCDQILSVSNGRIASGPDLEAALKNDPSMAAMIVRE